jgi:hypothetical protein
MEKPFRFLLILSLLVISFNHLIAAKPEKRKEISQYGITWTFDKSVLCGQFITGDWWVLGPVRIVKITPEPGPAPTDANVNIKKDQWGDTSLSNDNRMRNGSMIILKAGEEQGYDSRSVGYVASTSIQLPLELQVNRSLISTISNTSLPVDNF